MTEREESMNDAYRVVLDGHNYTKEHFPAKANEYVGHTPARDYEAALTDLLAEVVSLREQLADAQKAAAEHAVNENYTLEGQRIIQGIVAEAC